MGVTKTVAKWAVGAAVVWFIKERVFNWNSPVRIRSSKPNRDDSNSSSAKRKRETASSGNISEKEDRPSSNKESTGLSDTKKKTQIEVENA